ncbi:hypothetical protein ASPFODRAFT_45298, partial [Aspergillus luchuensis CBS 106.47]
MALMRRRPTHTLVSTFPACFTRGGWEAQQDLIWAIYYLHRYMSRPTRAVRCVGVATDPVRKSMYVCMYVGLPAGSVLCDLWFRR